MGDSESWGGFPYKMCWMWAPNHGGAENGGEEYQSLEKSRQLRTEKGCIPCTYTEYSLSKCINTYAVTPRLA